MGLGVAIGFGNLLAERAGPAWVAHAVRHASVACAAALAVFGAWRLGRSPRAPRDPLGRLGRALTLAGLGAVVLALLAEAVAAALEPDEGGALHRAARLSGVLVLGVAFLGLLAWTLAATRARLLPRWAVLAVLGVGALVVGSALAGAGLWPQ